MAHTGFIGAVVAAGIAAVVYVTVEETMSGENENSSPDDSQEADASATQQADPITEKTPSLLYRLFNGKSAREAYNTLQDDQQSTDLTGQETKKSDGDDTDRTKMDFSPTLQPEANKILSGRKVVIGVSDAGKSNAIAVIAEEIGGPNYGAALFLLDTEDEYRKLNDKKYLKKPLWMDRSKLTPDNAFEFAQWAVHNLRQVIINLQSYEDHEAAWVMINLIKGVQAYEETHEMRVPCEIILDEATVWLPQMRSQSTLSKFMVDDPDGLGEEDADEDEDNDEKGKDRINQISLLSLLERAFFSVVVRRGRKRGMGFTLAAQRIAEINKSALQANWTFLMRQTQAADFREYKKFGIDAKEAMELQAGEAFVFPPGKPMERHRFRLRHSPHGANTPGLDELRTHQQRLTAQPTSAAPAKRMPEQQATMSRTTPTQTQNGARHLYSTPRTNESSTMEEFVPTSKKPQASTPVPSDELEIEELDEELEDEQDEELDEREQLYMRALDAWKNNARSIRKIQDALDLNFNEARELLEEMDKLGLIAWQRKGEKANV